MYQKGCEFILYYGLIMVAVFMFSGQFYCNKRYQTLSGSSFFSAMMLAFGGSIAGLITLLVINKFQIDYTPFTLLMASLAALNGMLCTFCTQKAFGHINLSLYSIFSQLGGMAIPFVAGIIFYDEDITLGKMICLITIVIAMFMTLNPGIVAQPGSRRAVIYYIGIFTFNGMSGFISKIFASANYTKTNAAAYSILTAACTVVLAGIVLLILLFHDRTKKTEAGEKKKFKLTLPVTGWMASTYVLNNVANFFLVIALAHLPASVQYPMITGGIKIVSTLLCYLTPAKPGKREIGAVILSFIGILALVLL